MKHVTQSKKYFLSLCAGISIFLFLGNKSYAQSTGYLCGLSPAGYGVLALSDNSYTILNASITSNESVVNAALDPVHQRYFFHKEGGNISDTIIVLNAMTGSVLQRIAIPNDVLSLMEYNEADGRLYGLGASGFGALNLVNGIYFTINPNINWDNVNPQSAIDAGDSRYIYTTNAIVHDWLLVLNTVTGDMVFQLAHGLNLTSGMEYSADSNELYSLGGISNGFNTFDFDDSSFDGSGFYYYQFNGGANTAIDLDSMYYFCLKDGGVGAMFDTLFIINAVTYELLPRIPINDGTLKGMEYTTLSPVGVNQSDYLLKYVVFPNPVTSFFKIQFPDYKKSVQIYLNDASGKLVLFKEFNHTSEIEMSVEGLVDGTYILNGYVDGKYEIYSTIVKE